MSILARIVPMKAVSGELPNHDDGWAYEIKWDGMRALAFCDGKGACRLQSSRGNDITFRFPELAGLGAELADHEVILDGEIVAPDEEGRPNFGRLQHRMHVADAHEAARRAASTPVRFLAFDLLYLDGRDVTPVPYHDRRRLLIELVPSAHHWEVPAHHIGEGAALLEAARAQGLEGLVAKRLDSPYESGRRSPAWRKVKARRRQEFVVGGWQPGRGNRAGTVGSLLIGYYEPGLSDPLRYAGKVGTGFGDAELRRLQHTFAGLAMTTCPFEPPPPPLVARTARWLRPDLVAEVAFGEWTTDGVLRHPVYLGLRADKDASRVVREP